MGQEDGDQGRLTRSSFPEGIWMSHPLDVCSDGDESCQLLKAMTTRMAEDGSWVSVMTEVLAGSRHFLSLMVTVASCSPLSGPERAAGPGLHAALFLGISVLSRQIRDRRAEQSCGSEGAGY